jgi:hypothetical protein
MAFVFYHGWEMEKVFMAGGRQVLCEVLGEGEAGEAEDTGAGTELVVR